MTPEERQDLRTEMAEKIKTALEKAFDVADVRVTNASRGPLGGISDKVEGYIRVEAETGAETVTFAVGVYSDERTDESIDAARTRELREFERIQKRTARREKLINGELPEEEDDPLF